ncbi:MAG: hypothetical protein R2752_13905 [Vicinamibacterales bacterium]
MRLADAILRQGHLSERALTDALMTGERPAHLDACDLCSDRAVELSRWLDDVRALGIDAADRVFPPEMLHAQQAQIMRRLEQIEQPVARVIAFPAAQPIQPPIMGRRVAPAWLGVAAAAGLILGVIGGQVTARLGAPASAPAAAAATVPDRDPAVRPTGYAISPDDLLRSDLSEPLASPLDTLDQATPRLVAANIGG